MALFVNKEGGSVLMDAMGTAAGQFVGLCNQESSCHGHGGSSEVLQLPSARNRWEMLQECANRNTHVHKGAQAPPNKTSSLARRWELPNPDLISRPHLRDSSDKIILRCLFLHCCVLPPSYKAACPAVTVSHPAASLLCHSPASRVFTGHDNFRRQLKETENPFTASPSHPCCAPRHLGVTGTDQGLSLLSGKGSTWLCQPSLFGAE